MNKKDRWLLGEIGAQLATVAQNPDITMHDAITSLLWGKHLLETLLRQMQDDE